uniref:Uncharacterized protein n=1 Tax=Eptatretus burgeri TaxID=7764 RepID=A0A8C4QPA8_EPTBU
MLCVLPLTRQACARPLVTVYGEKGDASGRLVVLPAVFRAPIRPDIVNFVHSNVRKNNRQPYAVSAKAGGFKLRARPGHGGVKRNNNIAFGGGASFAPRDWILLPISPKALFTFFSVTTSDLFTSTGHAIQGIPEVPLVVEDKVQSHKKTKEAVLLLKLNAWSDI